MCPAKSVSVSVTVSNSADKEADVQKAACVCVCARPYTKFCKSCLYISELFSILPLPRFYASALIMK